MSQDRYERLVAVVFAGGTNVNEALVQGGDAWVSRQYAQDPDYCMWEGDARKARRGLWALPTDQRIAAWEWRRDRSKVTDYSGETVASCVAAMGRRPAADPAYRSQSSSPAQPSGACLIKGNISDNGRIYHVPGSRWYEATRIDESRGERWFCTEQEARAAG